MATSRQFQALVRAIDRAPPLPSAARKSSGAHVPLSDRQKQRARTMFDEGKGVLDVSFELGIPESMVRRLWDARDAAVARRAARGRRA